MVSVVDELNRPDNPADSPSAATSSPSRAMNRWAMSVALSGACPQICDTIKCRASFGLREGFR